MADSAGPPDPDAPGRRVGSPRQWAALDLILRPHADTLPAFEEGFLEAFLDDHSPTAIVDPPAPAAGPIAPADTDSSRRIARAQAAEGAEAARAWRVFFATPEARDRARAALATSDWQIRLDVTPIDVEDEGWAARSQATLTSIQVGRLIVAPPWDLPVIASGTVAPPLVIEIEPSMGFGTGHHQSTRLCLRALQAIEIAGRTVLDLGTGSGVLAIAAAKLGAASVWGIDEDPDAVDAAAGNVQRNGVLGFVNIGRLDVTDRLDGTPADIVLANLTGALLVRYAGAIVQHAVPEGLLILSGFTEDERFSVAHAFRDLAVVGEEREDGWIGLTLQR